jgi:hypothetical protein
MQTRANDCDVCYKLKLSKDQEHYKYKETLKINNLFIYVFTFQKSMTSLYIEKKKN